MQGRDVVGPYQPAARRQTVDGGLPVATGTSQPTPTIAKRYGDARYASYGENERKRAGAGERFYFVRTEAPITRRQTNTGSAAAQQTGSSGSGINISGGVSGSGGASGGGSASVSGSDSGSSASASNSGSDVSRVISSSEISTSSSSVVTSPSSTPSDISSSSSSNPSSSSSTDLSSSSPDTSSSIFSSHSSISSPSDTSSSIPSITPDVSSLPPSVTPPPNATSRGISTTIFSTVILTNSDGSESTSVIAIPTVLPYPSNAPTSSDKRTIIIGASIGGVALVVIITALLIFLKRSEKVRLNYKKLRVFGRRRQNLLDDEDDDWLEHDHDGPGPGFRGHGLRGGSSGTSAYSYADYPRPVSTASSTRFRGAGGGMGTREGNISGHTTPFDVEGILAEGPVKPAPSPSPYLLGMRATGSGSIFQEHGVWPPPGEQSRLIDPLVAASSQVELGNIVDHVMGGPTTPAGAGPIAGSSQPVHARQPSAQASLGAHTSRELSSKYAHSTMSSYGSGSVSQYPPTRNQSISMRSNTQNVQNAPPAELREQWEAARAQSPDSVLYDLSRPGGTLAVVNADPMTPAEGPHPDPPIPLLPPPYSSTTTVAGTGGGGAQENGGAGGQSTNWLERHPRESLEFNAI